MMYALIKSKWKPWLPHLAVIIWLLYLAITIWQHALHSVQPPLDDPLDYMQKAMSFWQAVGQGRLFNPFSMAPSVRPPGTILMSYPFGFSPDFHGFHFRSVFFSILSVVAAVYVVAGRTHAKAAAWWVASIAFLFSSLPMFYHFDWTEDNLVPSFWGLVDSFQAGVAALATAALVRSLVARSQLWLLFASLLASFTLLVKPSGMMVMALMALVWLMVIAFEWVVLVRNRFSTISLRAYAFRGAAQISAVYAIVIAICVFFGYLSKANFAYAQQALAVWKVSQSPYQQTLLWFHQSSGEALVLWVLGVGALFIYHLPATRKGGVVLMIKALMLLVGSLLVWVLGVWYWQFVQGGGSQIRYFYPFMLMGTVCVVPAALHVWIQASLQMRSVLMAVCFAPALSIAGLLADGDSPPLSWQKMAGVSMSVGGDQGVVRQSYALLDELQKKKENAHVYTFSRGVFESVFASTGRYEKMVRPARAGLQAISSADWLRGFAVRINELLDCDYILIRQYSRENAGNILAVWQIASYEAEVTSFEAWLSTLNEQSGIEIAYDAQPLRVLRIVDRTALNQAIEQFVSTHSWRPEFVRANPPIWWDAGAMSVSAKSLAADNISFDGVYKLHALSINRVDSAIKVEVWWEELRHEDANNQRYLFLHLVDASGAILHNQQIALYPYAPPSKSLKWRYGAVIFNDVLPDEKLTSLAFGMYNATTGDFLLADKKGLTDWEGRRNLIPIANLASAQAGQH